MMKDLIPKLGRRRAAWGTYENIDDVVKKTRNTRLRAHLFNTTVLPALTYASETWASRKQEENAVSVSVSANERVMLGVSRFTQVRDGIQSSLLRQRSKIGDSAAFAKEGKIRWDGHVMRFNDNRWTRATGFHAILSALQEDHRSDGQICSRNPSKKIMMLFVSHVKGGTTGLLWHAIGTNGRITGARSTISKINGSQGDQDDQGNALQHLYGKKAENCQKQEKKNLYQCANILSLRTYDTEAVIYGRSSPIKDEAHDASQSFRRSGYTFDINSESLEVYECSYNE